MCVKTALHPASHIFLMEINELCVSPDMIWSSLALLGGFINSNSHSLVDIIVHTFGRHTVIGGRDMNVVVLWRLCGLI